MSSSQNQGNSTGANSGDQAPPCAADFFAVRQKLCRKMAEGAVLVSERGSPLPSEGTSAQPAGSSSSLIRELIDEPESTLKAAPERVMTRPPVETREIVCGLRAGDAPVKVPVNRKRSSAASDTAINRKRGGAGSSVVGASDGGAPSQFRAKFISTLDEMLEDYGSEMGKIGQELAKSVAKVARLEGKLGEMEGSHAKALSQAQDTIDDLRGGLGDMARKYRTQKKLRKEKTAEIGRLQRELERMGSRSGDDVTVTELRARLAKIASLLGTLEAVYKRDVDLASIQGGLAEVEVFRGGQFPSFESEEERLSTRWAGVPPCEGDFASLMTALRLDCSYEPAPEDPMACDDGEVSPSGEAGAGEEEVLPADE